MHTLTINLDQLNPEQLAALYVALERMGAPANYLSLVSAAGVCNCGSRDFTDEVKRAEGRAAQGATGNPDSPGLMLGDVRMD